MPTMADEVNAWVESNWDEGLPLREWWRRLAAAGYSQPTWPVGLGGLGVDDRTARLINDVLAAHHVVAAPTGIGPSMGGPTLPACTTRTRPGRSVTRRSPPGKNAMSCA